MRYINDCRYFSDDKAPEWERSSNSRQNFVKLYQKCSPDEPSEFHSDGILAIRSLQIIYVGGELYWDNSHSYNFIT